MNTSTNENQTQEEIREIELSKIEISSYQPRKQFRQEEIEGLAASIRTVGLIHPPLVRPLPGKDTFELIAGERRFRAAQLAGLEKILVIIRHGNLHDPAHAALIENVQRVDLNPMEIANALKSLLEKFGYTQEILAEKIGKKRSTVANYLRLLSLPKNIQESISEGKMTMGHAKIVLSVSDPKLQQKLHERIVEQECTVREADEMASRFVKGEATASAAPTKRDRHVEQLTEMLQRRFGTRVTLQEQGKGKGRIAIEYYNLDDLDRVLDLLGIRNGLE